MTGQIIVVGLCLLLRASHNLRRLVNERESSHNDFRHASSHGVCSLWSSDAAQQPSVFFKLTKFVHRHGSANSEASDAWIRHLRTQLQVPLQASQGACSLLFVLGMIGTLIGLAITFAAISSGMSDTTDVEAVTASLQSAIRGLSTAFMTTLAGAFFGGVLVSRVNLITSRYLNEFLAILELWLRATDFPPKSEDGQ
ncbi:MotA/TolQ/ExbB proton channel family protein [Rhodopirellula sp. JC740]|uniref:MotA/TolQ/ExbB proton channel family protein n=2 Tax=Rhodopirellula halodulae TaxID=2894198 RepID=A0ABS8NNN0_9BACT|nr:MotA/TolQ/ExbB proton channel family protein [Rhodopirellula sp. JC740]